jgi:hypothetical protein
MFTFKSLIIVCGWGERAGLMVRKEVREDLHSLFVEFIRSAGFVERRVSSRCLLGLERGETADDVTWRLKLDFCGRFLQ